MRTLIDQLTSSVGMAVFAAMAGAGYILITVRFLRVLRQHPSSFTVAVLGFPGTGKTVFITTLFDELQQGKSRLRVSPYGVDTVEEVSRNLTLLSRGKWLPRTQSGNVFFFRAIASPAGSASARVRLEIADFAGEDLGELQPSDERWLHRGTYFKYVVDSDAIFLAVDGPEIAAWTSNAEEVVNALIAAIQIVAETRGSVGAQKLGVPVVLLIMKADLLDDRKREIADARLDRLYAICRTRCRYFERFFISSTGPLEDGHPPAIRRPAAVLEPLEWALSRARTVTMIDIVRRLLFPTFSRAPDRWENRG